MVEKTIQVIRETEANAEAIVKDADVQCKKILEDAESAAKRLKADQRDAVHKKAEAILEAAKKQGEQSQLEAMSDIENEIKSLKEAALEREEETVNIIVSQLV